MLHLTDDASETPQIAPEHTVGIIRRSSWVIAGARNISMNKLGTPSFAEAALMRCQSARTQAYRAARTPLSSDAPHDMKHSSSANG